MTARFGLWLLAFLCGVASIIRGRVDGLTLLAVVFLTAALITSQKATHK